MYRGGAEDLERTGPSVFVIDRSDAIHIYDPVGSRLLTFRSGALDGTIDTFELDIANVVFLAASSDDLLAVEVFFAPVRQRVHRIAFDGTLLETIDIPEGLQLEDGLSDVRAGSGDEILLEMQGGFEWGVWDGGPEWMITNTVTLGDFTARQLSPDIEVNRTLITADLAGSFGGLRWLGTADDGTVVLVRDDVFAGSEFEVLTTVEWYSSDGVFLASARVPALTDQYTDNPPGLAVTGDGRVLALITLETEVQVIELAPSPERITEM
jgi:hypothetical protein